MSEGGEARNHEEIVVEIVAWLRSFKSPLGAPDEDAPKMWLAADAIEARFRVRSSGSAAQNHEGGPQLCDACGKHLEQHLRKQGDFPRSPQGEDHEAGIEAALAVWPGRILTRAAVEAVVAAYLSRCPSPERNTEKEARLVEALRVAQQRLAFIEPRRQDADSVRSLNRLLAKFGSVVSADEK